MAHSNSTCACQDTSSATSESVTIQDHHLTKAHLIEQPQSERYPPSSLAFQVTDTPCYFSWPVSSGVSVPYNFETEPLVCELQRCFDTDGHGVRSFLHRSPTLHLPYDVPSLPNISDSRFLPDIPPPIDSSEWAILLGNHTLDTGTYPSDSAGLRLPAAGQVIGQLQSQITGMSGIVQLDRTRCYECSFAHAKKCLGHPDRPCHRCSRLLAAFAMKTPRPGTNFVIFSNMCSILKRIASLRDEVFLIRVQTEIALEEILGENIVISVDSGLVLSATPTSKISVVVKHLATTDHHIQSSNVFAPALTTRHLDSFTDIEALISNLEELATSEKCLITTAIRCCNYLGVLFNWDANTISFQRGHQNRTSMSQAKNLVLEVMYSISHRIRELLQRLWDDIRVYPVGLNPWHDPATVSCVLWILYSSLASFRQLRWKEKKLKFLDEFLTMLHTEAKEAMTSLEHYRRIMAFGRCGTTSQYQKAFKDLINIQKNRKPTFCFTYEGHETGFRLIQAPDHLPTYTYTDILLAPIPEDGGQSFEPEGSEQLNSALTKPFIAAKYYLPETKLGTISRTEVGIDTHNIHYRGRVELPGASNMATLCKSPVSESFSNKHLNRSPSNPNIPIYQALNLPNQSLGISRSRSTLVEDSKATTLTRKRKSNPASPSNYTPSHPESDSHAPASATFSQQVFPDLASLSAASEQETIPWMDLSELFGI